MNVVEIPSVTAHRLITGSYMVRGCPYCNENHPHILTNDELRLFDRKIGRGIYRDAWCKKGGYVITKIEE